MSSLRNKGGRSLTLLQCHKSWGKHRQSISTINLHSSTMTATFTKYFILQCHPASRGVKSKITLMYQVWKSILLIRLENLSRFECWLFDITWHLTCRLFDTIFWFKIHLEMWWTPTINTFFLIKMTHFLIFIIKLCCYNSENIQVPENSLCSVASSVSKKTFKDYCCRSNKRPMEPEDMAFNLTFNWELVIWTLKLQWLTEINLTENW